MNVPKSRIPVALVLAYARDSGSEYIEHLSEDFPALTEAEIEQAFDIALNVIKERESK